MLGWIRLCPLFLAFMVILPLGSFAGVGMGISDPALVDTLDPTLNVDPLADNILLPAGQQLTFHWTSEDINPGNSPEDFSATVWIDQQAYEQISFYPEIDQYTWVWTAPEMQTSDCHLEVVVRDLFGNTTIVNTINFTVLLSTTSVPDIPAAVQLGSPYPNPFNPSCEMAFGLPEAGNVDLQVFDTRGRLVRHLVKDILAAGNHQVHWDGAGQNGRPQPAGLYFFVLKTQGSQGPIQLVRKATLIP